MLRNTSVGGKWWWLCRAQACKNEAELAGLRLCHQKDGAALARLFAWLEGAVAGGETVWEAEVGEAIARFREASGEGTYHAPSALFLSVWVACVGLFGLLGVTLETAYGTIINIMHARRCLVVLAYSGQ